MPGIDIINETALRELLQTEKVDVGNGTIFGVRSKRDVDSTRLKLIISTGGSGKSAITSAIQKAKQTLKSEYENFVKFLVIDSSDREISAMEKLGVMTLPTSTPGANKRMDLEYRPEFFRRFMPENFPVAAIGGGGSGQQRMFGKMKFYDVDKTFSTTNDELFATKISNLFKSDGDWYASKDKPVDIMILSGLSGGNGSGSFIEIAARARKACLDAGAKSVCVYGYLMLPDTAEQWAESDLDKQNLHSNGFAALKELEHFMCVGTIFHDATEVIEAPKSSSSVTIDAKTPLYDYPVLISGSYDNATSLIGETIVNLMASTNGEFGQEEFYNNRDSAKSAALSVSNVSENGVIKPGFCPEDSHMYCGIGYANATIPEKIVIPNIIGRVTSRLFIPDDSMELPLEARGKKFCDKNHRLTRVEYEKAMRILLGVKPEVPVKEDTLWKVVYNNFRGLCNLDPNTADISYEEASTGATKTYQNGFHAEKKMEAANQGMVNYFEKLYERFNTNAKRVMEEFGPRAIWYLWIGAGIIDEDGTEEDYSDISLNQMLKIVENEFGKIAGLKGKTPEPLPSKGFLGKKFAELSGKKVAEFKQQFQKAIQMNVNQEVASKIIGPGGTLRNNFVKALEDYISICVRFADVLETLKDSYISAGRSLDMNSYHLFMEAAEREGNTVNLCRDDNMYNWVKNCAETKVYNVKTALVKQALIDDFVENSGEWASDAPGVARKRFDDVMSRVCELGSNATFGNGLKLSITDYFDKILEGVTDPRMQQDAIEKEAGRIVSLLRGHSAPSVHLQNPENPTKNTILMVPYDLISGPNGNTILQAFNKHLSGAAGTSGNRAQDKVVVSYALTNAIVCYQTCVAVPVSDLSDLQKWELDGYEKDNRNTTHLNNGEHETKYTELTKAQKDEKENIKGAVPLSLEMDQICGVGLSWKHYPSINLKGYQDDFSSGKTNTGVITIESAYRGGLFHDRIEYALKEHIIECKIEPDGVRYVLNRIPDDWDNLSLSGYPVDTGTGKMERGESLFRFLRDQNPGAEQGFQKSITLNSPFFSQPFDLSQQAKVLHWTEEKVALTHRSYMMRIMRKNVFLYQELEKTLYRYTQLVEQMKEQEKEYADLIHARLFCEFYMNGVIVRSKISNDTEWKIMVNDRGGNQRIVLFNSLYRIKMDDMNKGFVSDRMDLPIVYREFSKQIEDGKIDLDKVSALKNVFLDKLGDQGKDISEITSAPLERLLSNLERYESVFKGSSDPVGEMLEKYRLSPNMRFEAEKIVKFFLGLADAIGPYMPSADGWDI